MKHNHALFIDFAKRVAEESKAIRMKVGAVLARNGDILTFGYNGTPPGWDNTCEFWAPDVDEYGNQLPPVLVTRNDVVHAEMNVIKKMARKKDTIEGATLYLTLSPCKECAKLFLGIGLKEVIYIDEYRSSEGIELLRKDGINVTKWTGEICDS